MTCPCSVWEQDVWLTARRKNLRVLVRYENRMCDWRHISYMAYERWVKTPTGSGQVCIRRVGRVLRGMCSWHWPTVLSRRTVQRYAVAEVFSSHSILWHTALYGGIARTRQIASALSRLHARGKWNASQFIDYVSIQRFACTSAQAYPFVRSVVNEVLFNRILPKQFCICSD